MFSNVLLPSSTLILVTSLCATVLGQFEEFVYKTKINYDKSERNRVHLIQFYLPLASRTFLFICSKYFVTVCD